MLHHFLPCSCPLRRLLCHVYYRIFSLAASMVYIATFFLMVSTYPSSESSSCFRVRVRGILSLPSCGEFCYYFAHDMHGLALITGTYSHWYPTSAAQNIDELYHILVMIGSLLARPSSRTTPSKPRSGLPFLLWVVLIPGYRTV